MQSLGGATCRHRVGDPRVRLCSQQDLQASGLTWSCDSWRRHLVTLLWWAAWSRGCWRCRRCPAARAESPLRASPCWGNDLRDTHTHTRAQQVRMFPVNWKSWRKTCVLLHSCCRYRGLAFLSHTRPLNNNTGQMISTRKRTWIETDHTYSSWWIWWDRNRVPGPYGRAPLKDSWLHGAKAAATTQNHKITDAGVKEKCGHSTHGPASYFSGFYLL